MALWMNECQRELEQVLESMPEEHRQYVNRLLENAPLSLFEGMVLKRMKKGTIFIREQTPVDRVYILLKGNVQALEHRVMGNKYNYIRFRPVELFGSMEILLEIEQYKTTLMTESACTFLMMTRSQFEKWIRTDTEALLMEIKSMGTYLLEQARKERLFLFLQGRDRLFLIFMEEYQYTHDREGRCLIDWTRQELSEFSGLSIRTINRAIKSMEEEGYIRHNRSRIRIDESQYQRMREYLNNIVAE